MTVLILTLGGLNYEFQKWSSVFQGGKSLSLSIYPYYCMYLGLKL